MRSYFSMIIVFTAIMLIGCANDKLTHIQVTPKLCWHVRDSSGSLDSMGYRESTNYWATNHYAPFVVSPRSPFTMDFARRESFTSPDTHQDEQYLDGMVVHMNVTISNDTARFHGRCEYLLHEGVTKSYEEDDETIYAQRISSSSERFVGSIKLGREILVHEADSASEPRVYVIFRRTSEPKSKFMNSPVGIE